MLRVPTLCNVTLQSLHNWRTVFSAVAASTKSLLHYEEAEEEHLVQMYWAVALMEMQMSGSGVSWRGIPGVGEVYKGICSEGLSSAGDDATRECR
ncbi:hypothetical protein Tco_0505475 [Tanacetum coccineum]